MALAWDATRFNRSEMIALLHKSLVGSATVAIFDTPLYQSLQHTVDRVIKARDVIVLRK